MKDEIELGKAGAQLRKVDRSDLARGFDKSNCDVAAIPGCSPRTVNTQLEQIFQKLPAENRTAAAMLAVRGLTKG